MPARKLKVAAVQAHSTFYDKQACLETAKRLIGQAVKQDVKLIVFGELFMPGYPFHLWINSYGENLPYIAEYYENAVQSDGPEAQILKDLARQGDITIVIGVAERDHGSLYMAQWIVFPNGELVTRRKIRPTSVERILFGDGDGSDITVHETKLGRLGALQCWEHAQPLLKHAMALQHEEIHCASWPTFPPGLPHFSLSAEANYASCMSYAIETGTFVIVASQALSEQNVDHIAGDNPAARAGLGIGGALAQIIDPEGRALCDRPAHDKEALVIAEIDLSKGLVAKSILDTVGHYSRSDVFEVHFDNRPRRPVLTGAHGHDQHDQRKRRLRRDIFGNMPVGHDGGLTDSVPPVSSSTAAAVELKEATSSPGILPEYAGIEAEAVATPPKVLTV